MDHQQIRDGNELISNFMGSTIKIEQDDVKDIPLAFLKAPDLKFHASWKWLMPVVIKIEKDEGNAVRVEGTVCNIMDDGEAVVEAEADTKMEAVWKAVVAYLQAQ
jgi:hypothetical protein